MQVLQIASDLQYLHDAKPLVCQEYVENKSHVKKFVFLRFHCTCIFFYLSQDPLLNKNASLNFENKDNVYPVTSIVKIAHIHQRYDVADTFNNVMIV